MSKSYRKGNPCAEYADKLMARYAAEDAALRAMFRENERAAGLKADPPIASETTDRLQDAPEAVAEGEGLGVDRLPTLAYIDEEGYPATGTPLPYRGEELLVSRTGHEALLAQKDAEIERLRKEAHLWWKAKDDAEFKNLRLKDALKESMEVREEYEARIAELEAREVPEVGVVVYGYMWKVYVKVGGHSLFTNPWHKRLDAKKAYEDITAALRSNPKEATDGE